MKIGILGATGPAGVAWRRGCRRGARGAVRLTGRDKAEAVVDELGRSGATGSPGIRLRQRVGVRRRGRDPRGAGRRRDPDRAGARGRLAGQDRRLDGEQPREARQRVQRGAAAARLGRGRDPGAAVALAGRAPRSTSCPRRSSATLDHEMESDVVVLGDDDEAKTTVMEITASIPNLRPLDGGSLAQRGRYGDVRGRAADGEHPPQDAGQPAPHVGV